MHISIKISTFSIFAPQIPTHTHSYQSILASIVTASIYLTVNSPSDVYTPMENTSDESQPKDMKSFRRKGTM